MTEHGGVERLAAVVVAVQDRGRAQPSAVLSQRRARIIDAVTRSAPRRRVPWIGMGVVAAAAAAVVLVLMLRGPSALDFTVGDRPGTPGEWIAAKGGAVDVGFSDGSSLVIDQDAKARVDPGEGETRVVLESGALRLDVAPRQRGRWRVDAGPFGLKGAGTRFSVDWRPEPGQLAVQVQEGQVEVEGPSLSVHQVVTAGQAIQVSLPVVETLVRHDAIGQATADEGVQETQGVQEAEEAEEGATRRRRRAGARRRPSVGPSWRELATRGEHREAIEAAEAAGFEGLCTRLGAQELLVLADTARYARKSKRARQALKAVRRRFAGTKNATSAAYSLGLVAFDQERAYERAARSFRAYLTEAPRGGLAREAMGRLMESLRRAGRSGEARDVARRYRDRYPKGPHADLATELLMP